MAPSLKRPHQKELPGKVGFHRPHRPLHRFVARRQAGRQAEEAEEAEVGNGTKEPSDQSRYDVKNRKTAGSLASNEVVGWAINEIAGSQR